MKTHRRTRKCTLTKTCDTLADRVGDRPHKGIVSWSLLNVETGKRKPTLVGYVTSGKDTGLVFNFCPWCGYDMSKRIAKVESK